MIKTHKSKVSYGLLIIVSVVFFAPLIPNIIYKGINTKTLVLTVFLVLIYSLILHMFFKREYIIENRILKIKCRFFTYKPISINSIKTVAKTSNIISSPAASFDRIEITYGKFDEIIISPKNKLKFVKDLKEINPDIVSKLE